MLCSHSWRYLVFVLAAPILAGTIIAAESPNDPSVSTYGTRNVAAPAELDVFAFLVGKWTGTATARNADGSSSEFQFDWIGRYVLDGMGIADEMRVAESGAVQGMSLRYFDAERQQWSIEFLNFGGSFIRKQVATAVGGVVVEGTLVTINQSAPGGALGRERYHLLNPQEFTYYMDMSQDGGESWDDGLVVIKMTKVED